MLFRSTNKNAFIYSVLIACILYSNVIIKAHANDVRIISPRSNIDPVYDYFLELTRLVLSKNTHLYSKVNLVVIGGEEVTQSRSLTLLNHGYADLIWSGYTAKRDADYLPIRIPLFRGLLGYRVLLIRQEDKEKFLQIKTPDQLKKLIACQGDHWPDSDILEANGYLVLRVRNFKPMFRMLSKKRCDYFPRSIYEGYSEQREAIKHFPNIILMDELILHYNYPFYYYVNKNNVALAERVEKGLMTALADGSLIKLMKTHNVSKHLFPLIQWKDKRYFELTNEALGNKSSLKNDSFWIDLQTQ